MADGFCFKDIDGMVLTLPQTRQPYGRLLAIHCKAAYDNARKNMNVFGLTIIIWLFCFIINFIYR